MKYTPLIAAGALTIVGLNGGCATSSQTPVYNASQTGQIITEERGEIVSVRAVVIEAANPLGVFSGSPGRRIGSAVGTSIATGSALPAKIAVGSTVGGEIGAHLDDKAGEELSIRVAGSDKIIVVVQERSTPPLAPGERVRVLTGSSLGGRGPFGIMMGGGSSGGDVRVVRAEYFAGEPRELVGGTAADLSSTESPPNAQNPLR